jgi:hypothetical protein
MADITGEVAAGRLGRLGRPRLSSEGIVHGEATGSGGFVACSIVCRTSSESPEVWASAVA